MKIIMYVISIAMQVAGALLIMFFSLSTKREKVIIKFMSKDWINEDSNINELEYNHDEFINTYKQEYLGKFSFLYIALGYIFAIFGEIEDKNKIIISIIVIITTAFIILSTNCIVKLIIKKSKTINKEITREELNKLNLRPNSSTISNKEIDDIMDNL